MEQMQYELSVALRNLENTRCNIECYLGTDANYLYRLKMQEGQLLIKINKIKKAMSLREESRKLFEEAKEIEYEKVYSD